MFSFFGAKMIYFFPITVTFYSLAVTCIASDLEPSLIVKQLTWQYTDFNEDCTDAVGGRNPCQDFRICRLAEASIMIGGHPAICGSVGRGVAKVCCGLPLVLGKSLMKKIEEEKARTRACGTTSFGSAVSPTEKLFFGISRSLPPVDTSDPDNFDPPLDLTVEPMISSAVGDLTNAGKYPWMVAIFEGSIYLCGGSLIDRKHILSAAHCFASSGKIPDPSQYMVLIGSIHLDKAVPLKLSEIVIHENYDVRTHDNDIAMLTLEKEILLPSVAHICLPDTKLAAKNLTGLNVRVLGWEDPNFDVCGTKIKDAEVANSESPATVVPQPVDESFSSYVGKVWSALLGVYNSLKERGKVFLDRIVPGKKNKSTYFNGTEIAIEPAAYPDIEENALSNNSHTNGDAFESSVLHEVENVHIISNYQCNEAYGNASRDSLMRELTSDFICAEFDESGKKLDQGVTGGMLMYKNNVENLPDYHPNIPWVLVGIFSYGNQCNASTYPGVYTRVSSHMDWIMEKADM